MNRKLTAIIEREGSGYVALCPELDIASQGDNIEQARKNLQEALELFFETASPEEVAQRLHGEVYVTQVEVAVQCCLRSACIGSGAVSFRQAPGIIKISFDFPDRIVYTWYKHRF